MAIFQRLHHPQPRPQRPVLARPLKTDSSSVGRFHCRAYRFAAWQRHQIVAHSILAGLAPMKQRLSVSYCLVCDDVDLLS
jgi:hypothetical protein